MEKFRITLNGVCHEVEVERVQTGHHPQHQHQYHAAPAAAAAPAPATVSAPAPTITGGEKVSAPMPGKILAVEVSEGQAVKRGDNLLILEAMKMQNEIKAPRDGIIKALFVTPGKAVTSGEVLLIIE